MKNRFTLFFALVSLLALGLNACAANPTATNRRRRNPLGQSQPRLRRPSRPPAQPRSRRRSMSAQRWSIAGRWSTEMHAGEREPG